MSARPTSINDDDWELFERYVLRPRKDGLRRLEVEHPDSFKRLYHDLRGKREAQKVRRATSLEVTRRLSELIYDGASLEEIAAAFNRKPGAARMMIERRGLHFTQRGDSRRLSVWVGQRRLAALDALAADLGADRLHALEYLLNLCLEEDAHVARRILRLDRSKAS